MDGNNDKSFVKIEPKQEEEIYSHLQDNILVSNETFITIKDEITITAQCSKSLDNEELQQTDCGWNIKTEISNDNLASKYACIVFLACLRFETSKRKLQSLSFPALKRCAEQVMNEWTYTSSGPDYFDTEMDKEFLLDLRDLRVLLDKEKEHKSLVCACVKSALTSKAYSEAESCFRSYSRSILTLATSLHRVRELRNLFYDFSVILENWKHTIWSVNDLEIFLNAYTKCALSLDVLKEADLRQKWERYMTVVSNSLVTMYKN
ncbi:acidic fibroblast growth factor intracellular-binding protein B-like [Photinus pyralis]|uniref:acidic fibroblast growth factor intracellular-binding protein B-like n=1 Tax=Photinus pyralis TaxID=7054 RepID=UPI0012670680|nr:acidic fibroblast growth factor intracellular-binding protein B-like [Photinus pyralis]